jgi:4-hydroxy-tetrahydrodipicolinate synthase
VTALRGIWAAVLTPVAADLQPDADRAIPYYRDLLQNGCDGINVMGTTGEAMSFGAGERIRYLERLASSGLPAGRIMAGTGAAGLDDAVRLTRSALDIGFAAALVMPPFFFREASDDGIVAFFEALIARANPPARSLLLYNFPRMSGITFHTALVDRLLAASGDRIAGMKDSSNDARLQADLAARHPSFAVFPGSEKDLLQARTCGAAGCISGSVALWPHLAKRVFTGGDETLAADLTRRRAVLNEFPLVPAMRWLTSRERSDPEWERAMPPQQPLSAAERSRLSRAMQTP